MLSEWNNKFNLVGKSTLQDPVRSHILDSIQISKYISNKNAKIIDIGTGAGFPGLVLSIYDFVNLYVVDSNSKKINFIKHVKNKLKIPIQILHSRIEDIKHHNFDYVISRALAKLDKLLLYSSLISSKKTKLIFLKGEMINNEISYAKQNWDFHHIKHKSISDNRGSVILIKDYKQKI